MLRKKSAQPAGEEEQQRGVGVLTAARAGLQSHLGFQILLSGKQAQQDD